MLCVLKSASTWKGNDSMKTTKWTFWNDEEAILTGLYRRFKKARRWKRNLILVNVITWVFA